MRRSAAYACQVLLMVKPARRRRRVWCDAGDRARGAPSAVTTIGGTLAAETAGIDTGNQRTATGKQWTALGTPRTAGAMPADFREARSVRVQRYLPSCHRREPRRSDEACEAIPHALPHQQCANLRETQAVADGQQTGVAASPRHKAACGREAGVRDSCRSVVGGTPARRHRSLSGRQSRR